MSLKKCVLALLLMNLGYFGYSQGWFVGLTGGEASQREPDRIKKQINEGAIRIETAAPTAALAHSLGASGVPVCPKAVAVNESWLVYMGPYANKDLLVKKKAELQKLKVQALEVSKPSHPFGLSLGRYASESLAKQALLAMNKNGVRTASVILWEQVRVPSAPSADKCPA